MKRLPINTLKAFMEEVFTHIGVPAGDARICSDILIASDLRGIESHGIGRLKTAIQQGRFGRITFAAIYVPWWRPQSYYDGTWRGTWALDGGGALMNQSIHYIDLLLWFMGDVAKLGAFSEALDHPSIEVEDCASAALKFKSGAQGCWRYI